MPNHSRPTVAAWCENGAASASERSTERRESVQSKGFGAASSSPCVSGLPPTDLVVLARATIAMRPTADSRSLPDDAPRLGGDLGQPFRTIAWCVHALPRAGNRPTPIEGF